MQGQLLIRTPQDLHELNWSYAPSFVVETALQVGLFDVLASGPRDIAELALQTNTTERGLRMLSDVLVSIGLLERAERNICFLPDFSRKYLVSTSPDFQGGLLRHHSEW